MRIELVDDKSVNMENAPDKGRSIELEFIFSESTNSIRIPFTEIPLAAQWGKFLQELLQDLHSEPQQ
ncbi:MAG: hypothetical protein V7K57_00655, partial [Nostoc sp.]